MTAQIVSLDSYRKGLGSELLQSKRPYGKGGGMSVLLRREELRWVDHRDEPRHPVAGVSMPLMTVDGQDGIEGTAHRIKGHKVRSGRSVPFKPYRARA